MEKVKKMMYEQNSNIVISKETETLEILQLKGTITKKQKLTRGI